MVLTSGFELAIFLLGFFGSDYPFPEYSGGCYGVKKIFRSFQFLCDEESNAYWDIDGASTLNMMVFKFHFIVIFMYTAIIWVVLWEVPYRYGRLIKTQEEKNKAHKKQKKKAKRKAKKMGAKNAAKTKMYSQLFDLE